MLCSPQTVQVVVYSSPERVLTLLIWEARTTLVFQVQLQ